MIKSLRRAGCLLALLLLFGPLPVFADSTEANCGLCIVEIQTQGNVASEEYIVIKNRTTEGFDMTDIIIKYFTAAGNPSTRTISLSGVLAPDAELAFVSDSLKTANPDAGIFPSGLALADAGGTLQLLQGITILDEVGWGTASLREDIAAPVHPKGYSLVRQDVSLVTDDTGNNAHDFMVKPHACHGISFNEIQPLLIGLNGEDIEPGIELLKTTGANESEDCPLLINDSENFIAASDLTGTSLPVITQLVDGVGNVIDIPFEDGENTLQFLPEALFGEVSLPGVSLTQSTLAAGQSFAKFGTTWKATYVVTLGNPNIFAATSPVNPGEEPPVDDTACVGIIMSELLPNPAGEDSGNEWVEFFNTSTEPIFLGDCVLLVGSTKYGFGQDQFIDPGEYVDFTDFAGDTSIKTLTLRNSDVNTVSFGRDNADIYEPLQTIQYDSAPEGQSWARFSDGWRWSPSPSPSAENTMEEGKGADDLPITELAAVVTPGTGGIPVPTTGAAIQITELLPNPAAPGTDENDEYVELYNPTNATVSLAGYKLQTGSSYNYSFIFTDQTISAAGYLLITSGSSSLTLSNSGGRARLLDPNGAVASETEPYTEAEEGNAWTFVNGTWQWTSSPTPAGNNVVVVPVVKAAKKTTKAATKAKKATAKKAAATKAKTTKAKTPTATADDFAEAEQAGKLHPGIIAGVGLLAVGYAAYEYRRDIANRYQQLRNYRGTRRTSGK